MEFIAVSKNKRDPSLAIKTGHLKKDARGRWRYKNGRFAPIGKDGRPLPPGWKKDSAGRSYNVQDRRDRARRTIAKPTGKRRAPKDSYARRLGIELWKGPPVPVPRNVTIYTTRTDARAIHDATANREGFAGCAAAFTLWVNEHGTPGARIFNTMRLTVARHAELWASGLLAYHPDIGWKYFATTPTQEDVAGAVSDGHEEKDTYELPGDIPDDSLIVSIVYPAKAQA